MELIEYLLGHFLSREALLQQTKIRVEALEGFQDSGLMPQCSYRLEMNLTCESFFGQHLESKPLEFYAKGYAAWLGMLQEMENPTEAEHVFKRRYRAEIERLNKTGFTTEDPKLNEGLEKHLNEEWQHFLNGTYGLCTTSGLPEDIAAKELAIAIIKPWQDAQCLNETELRLLAAAVDLLDRSSAMFAPHERARSSRHRLIDEVRRRFRF